LQLTPKQLFAHQTIAELAAMAGTIRTIQAEQGLVTGTLPLTPIQQWFFEQNHPDPHHWNQAVSWKCGMYTTPAVGAGSAALIGHHDAPARFVRTSGWQQFLASLDGCAIYQVICRHYQRLQNQRLSSSSQTTSQFEPNRGAGCLL